MKTNLCLFEVQPAVERFPENISYFRVTELSVMQHFSFFVDTPELSSLPQFDSAVNLPGEYVSEDNTLIALKMADENNIEFSFDLEDKVRFLSHHKGYSLYCSLGNTTHITDLEMRQYCYSKNVNYKVAYLHPITVVQKDSAPAAAVEVETNLGNIVTHDYIDFLLSMNALDPEFKKVHLPNVIAMDTFKLTSLGRLLNDRISKRFA